MIGSIVFDHLMGKQNPPWLYITLGSVYYFGLIIFCLILIREGAENKLIKKLILGGNLSYILIALGTFLVTGFWNGLGILITSIALGFVTPLISAVLENID
ncbi:hypothetical protein [[Phormidium] sp. ETS-05]|uniref:hypothetical protein n=1 Tax=[Phormidium] sp. ETS-05 TaxID=222819 RepID=UPI0018EF1393|nr:hypothetical protein [[Phormidium] sp. ETS-05]